ncbi:hypothetical protein FLJC2902T_06330 [Flavobacterium limnosediminis JC2902]|uniref:Amine oxidase domain-containing protein n=1 Tax=Flavobacterium limnosediminis JC2902 TaxID=1341181 RepID=V6SRA9_9FLAO|nr:NAD(P)/FAD-dependent oxidoreductase [Flavobacterium limnosediminis]ESU29238.1 hypothetical protein FLJC2902T_06330 [Flavobacterium limnosediminis JC2902]
MKTKTALIIGGGPAGLTAAYEFLKHTDIIPVVIEMSSFWGGISRTEEHNGNRIDIGGHRFFSKSDEIMEWWQDILPIHSESKNLTITYHNQNKDIAVKNSKTAVDSNNILLIRKRKSRIYFNKTFFDYPISLNFETLKNLGIINSGLIGLSYIKAVLFPIKNVETLDHFFINRFGERLYKTFFKDYTEKVWGVPCSEISAEWGAQRIKGLSITKSVLNFLKKAFRLNNDNNISQKDTETSLIEYFLYPKFGPGQMWEVVAEKVGQQDGILKQNCKVTKIITNGSKVNQVEIQNRSTGMTETLELDYCISTMPVNELINAIDCNIPQDVKRVSEGLMYRDFITVGLLLNNINHELEDNWIYIQENYVKVGRLQIFNNWSPYMVNDSNKTWVGLEYFCNADDEIWNMDDRSLTELAISEMIQLGFISKKEDAEDSKVIKVPKNYPAYFGTYSEFDTIKEFTNSFENLFLIGRNGMHKYNNQDHSMLTAIKTVANIKNNVFEKEDIWAINTEESYHEQKKH